MAITVNEIANICGVSRTTVLRSLNGTGSVRKETRDKILTVAKENNYRPNLLARSLNHGRTMSLGVVTINMENLYFVQYLDAINRTAEHRGFFTNIVVCDESLESERKLIEGLADRQVEGVILSPLNKDENFEIFLKSMNIPFVCLGNKVSPAFTTICIDEKQAAADALQLIVEKGYEQVVFVCPPLENKDIQNIYVHEQRLQGVQTAAKQYKRVNTTIIGTQDYLLQVRKQLDAGLQKKTAYLCSGDIYALEIMSMGQEMGLNIPQNFGLMGFDDLNILRYVTPKLSTVSTSIEGLASSAVKELISAIEDEFYEPKTVILNHTIVDRETL